MIGRLLDPVLLERLAQLQLSARRVVEGSTTGLHRSPLKGASVDFRQHRFYVPGDEPRRLDWRVLARTDRPYVKEYDEETNLQCQLVLDCSGSMAYAGKFEYARQLAAALAYLMLGQTESVGLSAVSSLASEFAKPQASGEQLNRLLNMLEGIEPAGHTQFDRTISETADRLRRRALVIIVSDLLAPIEMIRKGIARLHHDRHELIVLRILHRDELEFPFKTWTRFSGYEGEAARVVEPAVARATYLANFDRHAEALKEICRTSGAELRVIVSDVPLADALTQWLAKR